MAFRTAVVIAGFLIGLGGLARESFAQYYPPQAYPPPRDYPLAGYPALPPVDPDDDAPLLPRYYDLPAASRSHTGAAGPGQVDPVAPGLMRGDPRTIAALPPEVRPETGAKKELPPQLRRTLVDYYAKEPVGRFRQGQQARERRQADPTGNGCRLAQAPGQRHAATARVRHRNTAVNLEPRFAQRGSFSPSKIFPQL